MLLHTLGQFRVYHLIRDEIYIGGQRISSCPGIYFTLLWTKYRVTLLVDFGDECTSTRFYLLLHRASLRLST